MWDHIIGAGLFLVGMAILAWHWNGYRNGRYDVNESDEARHG